MITDNDLIKDKSSAVEIQKSSKKLHNKTKAPENKPAKQPLPLNKDIHQDIPYDLKQRLETEGIRLDFKLIKFIKKYHISQAYAAITHVENSSSSIGDPTAVFRTQLPKQVVEKNLGARTSTTEHQRQSSINALLDEQINERKDKGEISMLTRHRERINAKLRGFSPK